MFKDQILTIGNQSVILNADVMGRLYIILRALIFVNEDQNHHLLFAFYQREISGSGILLRPPE
jgi:hypothetical protein